MFVCPACFRQYLVGQGWIPPPCIFKSSHTIRELPEENKCIFTHIECECGQHIGLKVISGLQKNLGFWRMQFDCQDTGDVKKDDFEVAKINFTHSQLKHIYHGELTNQIHKILDVHTENMARIFIIQKMVKKFNKKSRTNSL